MDGDQQMMHLVFAEFRRNAATWAGAFAVAVACGFVGGWGASILATARAQTSLGFWGGMVLAFSAPSAAAAVSSVSRLAVVAQRRSFALWQLANVSPRLIARIVRAQLAAVGFVGAAFGTLLETASVRPLFPLVFCSPYYQTISHTTVDVGLPLMPWIWLGSAAVFVLGGARSARLAGTTPPIAALQAADDDPLPSSHPGTRPHGARIRRTAAALVLMVMFGLASSSLYGADPASSSQWGISPFLPLLASAAFAVAAPLLLPSLFAAWSRPIPQRCTPWMLARASACHSLTSSTAMEVPIAVGIGVVCGVSSISDTLQEYIARNGIVDMAASLDFTSTLLLFGGPVILCAVGAASSVIMTSHALTNDARLLAACGARRTTIVAARVLEVVAHTVNALIAGLLIALASDAVVSTAAGLPALCGFSPIPAMAIAALGLLLLASSMLIPTVATVCSPYGVPMPNDAE